MSQDQDDTPDESAQTAAALVEMSTEPLYSVDSAGQFETVNSAFVALSGYDRDALVGSEAASFLHPDDRADWRRRRQLLFDDGTAESDPWVGRLCSKTGTDIPVEWQLRLHDGDRTTGRARDLRESRQKEQKLMVLNRALRHNIRNRMNLIINKAVTLQAVDDEGYQTAAEQIESIGETVVSISDKARKAQEHVEIVPDTECQTDLCSVADTIGVKFSVQFPNATLETDIPAEAPARAPPSVGTAMMELLENAVVHHPSGTGPAEMLLVAESGRTHVRVRDECPPIPDSIVETLEQESEQPLQHNLGIGLWLVRWLVDSVDGTLSFDRQPDGSGNVVTMSFDSL